MSSLLEQPQKPFDSSCSVQCRSLAVFGGEKTVSVPTRDKWKAATWREVLKIARFAWSGHLTEVAGPTTLAFEDSFAKMCGTTYAIAMNSGTSTLHSAYFAVGVRPGCEVIVPSYTFFASAAPVIQLGGEPVFCDIDPRTLTIDPEDVERRITSKTKAICAVHIWGNPAAMDKICAVAARHNVSVIEDCSHAHGACYHGKPVGSWGDIGCFSLQGPKPVSGGESGIAVTNNPVLFDKMMALGHFGRTDQKADSFSIEKLSLGIKYRPHLFAIVLAQGGLNRLNELNRLRRANYEQLSELLADCNAVSPIESYPEAEKGGLLEFIFRYHSEHAGGWAREAFVNAVQAEGVPLGVDRYTKPRKSYRLLHEAPIFNAFDVSELGGFLGQSNVSLRETQLPATEKASLELVTLPPFTKVNVKLISQCAAAIRKVAVAAASTTDLRMV